MTPNRIIGNEANAPSAHILISTPPKSRQRSGYGRRAVLFSALGAAACLMDGLIGQPVCLSAGILIFLLCWVGPKF